MRIYLHIGPDHAATGRIQAALADKREQLRGKGVLFARSPGNRNHTRLYMAITDPNHIDPLRFNRGFITGQSQTALREEVQRDLTKEVETSRPETLILSSVQLGNSLYRPTELARLKDLLSPISDEIHVVAHVRPPAEALLAHYGWQIGEGRATPLSRDIEIVDQDGDWWDAALAAMPEIDPLRGQFEETQGPPFWLDCRRLVDAWEAPFGAGNVDLRSVDDDVIFGEAIVEDLRDAFNIGVNFGRVSASRPTPPKSAASLARGRQMNDMLLTLMQRRKITLPRPFWTAFIAELAIEGPPDDPACLGSVTARFAPACSAMAKSHRAFSDLAAATNSKSTWSEADPDRGFRASQYLLAYLFKINRASKQVYKQRAADLAEATPGSDAAPKRARRPGASQPGITLSDTARRILPPLAVQNFEKLRSSPLRPHNRLGAVDEEQLAAPFAPAIRAELPKGRSGNVIVGCMKNEAPYIVEWVAYHRAIGVDHFLIYTNDCTDGTTEILDRLQALGVVQHRNNDTWQGNSPQQWALNQALEEEVVKAADWIIHIDVDEFINIRTGNGTLSDLFDAAPDATNIAMTWRLFGHNGITNLSDRFVIDQFDTCAPKFCPKPHTVWGFKTMFRNIGAYSKISCHRPNKLDQDFENRVKWVNGSGRDMTKEVARNGWRNSRRSIGYDIVQLNHYALRSAESFLIKRQRGRALHVDRSIGLNYWIRMDWSDYRDVTIKRNLPRLQVEYDRLMADETLRKWHDAGRAWHRDKADELHGMPEFEDLYQQALALKLTDTERVAYSLALDMDS